MADAAPQDVPENLVQDKKSKDIAAEALETKADEKVTQGEAFLAALGYISFLCILPLVLMPKSTFAQFHGKQALVLAVFVFFMDFLQIFPARLFAIYAALKFVLILYCMVMSLKGKTFKLPMIYGLSQRFKIDINS